VTDIVPETEAVAITVSVLPVGPLPLLMGSPGGLLPPVPATVLPLLSIVPRLLLNELDPQPDNSNSEQTPMSSVRPPACM
jgi:hypothetical protein